MSTETDQGSQRTPVAQQTSGTPDRLNPRQAESALRTHYERLARIGYLVLPPQLGRHRRVLAAHTAVQNALPGLRARAHPTDQRPVPRPRAESGTDPAYDWYRARVLRDVLRARRPARWWPRLPFVLGARLTPPLGGAEELTLSQAVSALNGPARAAFVLRHLDGLEGVALRRALADAGVAEPYVAERAAAGVTLPEGMTPQRLRSPEFDPSAVQVRTTDLGRRRRRLLGAAAVALAVVAGAVAVPLSGIVDTGTDAPRELAADAYRQALDPALLARTDADAWADTSRVDFTAWPARGDRTGDQKLLGRALAGWAAPTEALRLRTAPGTRSAPPTLPPRLLYAGDVAGAVVVLLYDGQRIARYTEPDEGPRSLDLSRVDNAGVTSAAALTLTRDGDRARYLTAPWIAESAVRDLRDPTGTPRSLDRDSHGVTAPVPVPAGAGCERWPALQLRSSARIVERHTFLVTDLGDTTLTHLTYTPRPSGGQPARQPREALSAPALGAWERGACGLAGLRGGGVRAVNSWEFAEQRLPDGGGQAMWVCQRADRWRGNGDVRVLFRASDQRQGPGGVGTLAASAENTAACGRFGQHVLAGVRWTSPSGRTYQLAAGSREVTGITAAGGVTGRTDASTLALPTDQDAPTTRLTGRLRDGGDLPALR